MSDAHRTSDRLAIALVCLLLAGCDVDCPAMQDNTMVRYLPTGEVARFDFIDFRSHVWLKGFDGPIPVTCDQVKPL